MKYIATIVIAAIAAFAARAAEVEHLSLDGDHGKLSAVFEKPEGKAKYPAAIVMHGFAGNKEDRLLKTIARGLNKRGIAALRFDFNGHGRSEGRFQDMTVPNEVEDAKKVYAYLRGREDVGDIYLVGHSQGGVVASLLAGELGDGAKAIALLAPAAILKDNAIDGMAFGKKYEASEIPEYIELWGRLRLGREYVKTAQELDIYGTAARFKGEAIVIHGMADEIVPWSYGERYKDVLPHAKIVLLEKHNHGFTRDIGRVANLVADFFAGTLDKKQP